MKNHHLLDLHSALHFVNRSTWRYWDTCKSLFSSSRRHQTCIIFHPRTLTQASRRHQHQRKPLHHESLAQPHRFRSKLNSAPFPVKNQVTTANRSQSWEPIHKYAEQRVSQSSPNKSTTMRRDSRLSYHLQMSCCTPPYNNLCEFFGAMPRESEVGASLEILLWRCLVDILTSLKRVQETVSPTPEKWVGPAPTPEKSKMGPSRESPDLLST